MTKPSQARKAIKARFPHLKFSVRTISLSDLARDERLVIESKEWGMVQGNHETYLAVKKICNQFENVIVSW